MVGRFAASAGSSSGFLSLFCMELQVLSVPPTATVAQAPIVFYLNCYSGLLTVLSALTLSLESALYTVATASLYKTPWITISFSEENLKSVRKALHHLLPPPPCKLRFPLCTLLQSLWSWFSEKPSAFYPRTFAFAVPVP